jgi:hypothetical protein
MPSIDAGCSHFIHKVMSRPFRLVLPTVFLAAACGLSGCVGTIYDPMYSNRKNHFKAPEEKGGASAESILGALDKTKTPGAGAEAAIPGGPPPAGEVPGLPPAGGLPEAGAAPAPAAPAAPAPAAPPPNN